MLTNALNKIPVKYHKRLREGLLAAALMLILFGFLFVIGFMETETGILHWKKTVELSVRITRLIVAIILLVIGAFCLFSALKITQISGRYKKYMAIIKGNDKLFIRQIADITNKNERDVIDDLENMIHSEFIKEYYIDYKQGLLIDKSFITAKTVKEVIECETCGTRNEVFIGRTNQCTSCGNLIVSTSDCFYSAQGDSGAEQPAARAPEPAAPLNSDPAPEPTPDGPSGTYGWLGAAALAVLAMVYFRRRN